MTRILYCSAIALLMNGTAVVAQDDSPRATSEDAGRVVVQGDTSGPVRINPISAKLEHVAERCDCGSTHAAGLCDGCGSASSGCGCGSSDSNYLMSLLGGGTGNSWLGNGGFYVDGWLSQGITFNPDRPNNRFNGPVSFNDRSNEYQLNQLYLTLAKDVRSDQGVWDVGGRVDFLYGTDYFFTTANGLETHSNGSPKWNSSNGPRSGGNAALYGLAMPQMYAEIFAPIGEGLNIKVGHFYSILGYESVMAPDNFFYSHSYAKQYGEPFTHTGVLTSYTTAGNLKIRAGFTRGWNTWTDPTDTYSFLGGVSWTSADGRSDIALTLITGDETANRDNRTTYSLVYARQLNDRLKYVFQHDLGVQQNGAVTADSNIDSALWYGINQYLMYELNEKTSLGVRFEWFRDQDNARVLAIPDERFVQGGNYYELSFGANWKPNNSITVRPELRWDWSNVKSPQLGIGGMFDDFGDKNQFLFATDVIIAF